MVPDTLHSFHYGAIIALVLLAGGFVKCFTTLQIFRLGVGLYGSSTGILVVIFSTILSFFVVNSVVPLGLLLQEKGDHISEVQSSLEPFLQARTLPSDRAQLQKLQEKLKERYAKNDKDVVAQKMESPKESFLPLLMAFLLRELKDAFQIGLLFIIPFVIIDLLVVHVMQLLQVTQISSASFALPLKLLLFLAVDGWSLMTQRLVGEYLR